MLVLQKSQPFLIAFDNIEIKMASSSYVPMATSFKKYI